MPCPGDPGPRPSFIPLADCARVVFHYTIYGQTVENVFYFRHFGGYDDTTIVALVSAMTTAWETQIKPLLPDVATLDSITATGTATESDVQAVALVAQTGSNTGDGMETIGNTLCIKFNTGLSGRSFRGRLYWPILIEGFVAANVVAEPYASNLVAAFSDFVSDTNADTGDSHVIASYQNDCEWRTAGVATPVTSYSLTDHNLDSQRRRLSGRGV